MLQPLPEVRPEVLYRLDTNGRIHLVPRADGSVSVRLDIALPGVYGYPGPNGTTVLELVEESVLNDPAYLESLANGVVCNDHPNEPVTADNVKRFNDGNLGQTVAKSENGGPISADAIIRDATLLADVLSKKKQQVSAGYSVELDEDPATMKGVHPTFGKFDRRQKRRISNHVAIVSQARHGARARIRVDGAGAEWSEQEPANAESSMIVSPELRARLDKLGVAKDCVDPLVISEALLKEADKEAARADVADVKRTEAETALQTEKQARADAAKSPLNLDAYKEVAPLVSRAQALDLEIKGTPADLRKAIVLKVYPNLKTDKSDDYYQAILDNEQPRNPYKSGSTDFVPDLSKNDGANDPLVVEPPPKFK